MEIADESQVTSRAARRRAAADADDPNSIKVWIGIGRDQAQILKQMIEDTFTPETGIRVNLELVNEMQRLLVPASIAGTQPDVAIGVADMDLAFRGAVLDLATFPDFPEVAKRFKKSALLPFTFREHVFALPDIQSFPMLFYRKDILADLGLEVPQTWDDVFRILPELQNHHLEFGLTPSIYTYLQFLYQKGVSLYKEDGVAVNLDSEAAIQTFIEMTNLYTQSGLPLEFNFINRFRMGEMPLGISNYGDYNTLSVFAPELRGQWGMAPIPGVRMPDGTINRTAPVAHNVMVGTELTPRAPRAPSSWPSPGKRSRPGSFSSGGPAPTPRSALAGRWRPCWAPPPVTPRPTSKRCSSCPGGSRSARRSWSSGIGSKGSRRWSAPTT